jgi:hypothetical protein
MIYSYETGPLTAGQKALFCRFVEKKIGVEYDVDEPGLSEFVVTVFELTRQEAARLEQMEEKLRRNKNEGGYNQRR